MKRIKAGKLSINVPEGWDDVTLSAYNNALSGLKANAAVNRKAMAAAICALCGIKEATLLAMTKAQVDELASALGFFFNTSPQPKLQMEFEIDGTIFHVLPDIQDQTFGEFVDMDTLISLHKDDPRAAMAGIMAIYCRPAGEKYACDNLQERTTERTLMMGRVPIELAEGVSAFFLTRTFEPETISVQCGAETLRLLLKIRTCESSVRLMAGMRRLLNWHRMIFCAWMRSRLSHAVKS